MSKKSCINCKAAMFIGRDMEARVDPTPGSEDEKVLLAKEAGRALIEATKLPQPQRCAALAELLPTPPRGHNNGGSLTHCPEIGLMALVSEGVQMPADV